LEEPLTVAEGFSMRLDREPRKEVLLADQAETKCFSIIGQERRTWRSRL
jgi:hypothetical protein